MKRIALLVLPLIAACSATQGDYPQLLPTAQILAQPTLPDYVPPQAPASVNDALTGQADTLRNRADALRGPIIDPATRARMMAARNRQAER